MFLRALILVSFVVAGALALYLPSINPPERFLQQLRAEHALSSAFWGPARAAGILAQTLDFYEGTKQPFGQPVPERSPPSALDAAVVERIAHATSSLAHNAYFRSIDALFMLALYRFAALIQWLPLLLVFILVSVLDGLLSRVVKSKSFERHHPEVFALNAIVVVIVACATLVAFVVPLTLHPVALAAVPIASAVCASVAIANYHR